jgi:uncharacterized protein (DUF2141 family)
MRPFAPRGSRMRAIVYVCTVAGVTLLAAAGALAEQQEEPCTGHAGPARLYVDVENVRNAEGLIAVTLYADDSSKFLVHHGSLYVGRVPAVASRTSVCIYLPATGVYALAVYHDANANRKFDRTAIGLPKEGFGFSNDPAVFLGMPRFSSVRLSVPRSGMRTSVRLRYP